MKRTSCQSIRQAGWSRNCRGNLLTIIIIVAGILMFFGLAIVSLGLSVRNSTKNEFAAEAAALAGATEISQAVINDEYFGYISLVDAPPVESNLRALDGQPLPVTGINSIIASALGELIIADKLGNDYLIKLARFEAAQARRAAASLEEEIQFALTPYGNSNLKNAQGQTLHPYEKAKQAFLANVCPEGDQAQQRAALEQLQFKMSLGWLKDGGSTGVRIPGEKYCPPDMRVQDRYRAVEQSFAGESFCLAAIGRHPALIKAEFQKPDNKHLSTIVRVEATSPISVNQFKSKMVVAAMAQPGGLPGANPPGSLVIDLGYSKPAGVRTLRDLLAAAKFGSTAEILTASGGDVPGRGAKLGAGTVRTGEARIPTRDLLGLALFDWLRTARGHVQIDSLLEALDTNLIVDDLSTNRSSLSNRFCRFDIGSDGIVHLTYSNLSPFPPPKARENQIYCYSPAALAKSNSGVTVFDHVHALGNLRGGRHAGQVAEGDSVNWIELADYAGSHDYAGKLGRGSRVMGIDPCGEESFACDKGIQSAKAYFNKSDGRELRQQPRLSYLSGGLAVLIKITPSFENVY